MRVGIGKYGEMVGINAARRPFCSSSLIVGSLSLSAVAVFAISSFSPVYIFRKSYVDPSNIAG